MPCRYCGRSLAAQPGQLACDCPPRMVVAPSAEANKVTIALGVGCHAPFAAAEPQPSAQCLEIASGTGQHVAHLAAAYPHVEFQPSEFSGGCSGPAAQPYGSLEPVFASIEAHAHHLPNVRPALELDASAVPWPPAIEARRFDAIIACNLCHIAPWRTTEGLLAGAARVLALTGRLFVYGAFAPGDGRLLPTANARFDARLREHNQEWGVRDASVLVELAERRHALRLVAQEEMPGDDMLLVFERTESARAMGLGSDSRG